MAWSKNARVLVVAMVLFGLITSVQLVAALVADSNALLVDCASMLVDTMTYAGNLYSEVRQEKKASGERALWTAGASLLVLYGITTWGLADAIQTLLSSEIKDDLEPQIVLIFGVLGVIVDGISLAFFQTAEVDESKAVAMNMWSALTHVLADTVRSVTSIALGLIVMLDRSLNGSRCDAYATFIVASTIILGNTSLVGTWCRLFRELKANKGHPRVPVEPTSPTDVRASSSTQPGAHPAHTHGSDSPVAIPAEAHVVASSPDDANLV